MTRDDVWQCDECQDETRGRFPTTWITQSTCVGSGYLDRLANTKHFCSPKCAGRSLLHDVATPAPSQTRVEVTA